MMVLRPQGMIPEKRRARELTEALDDDVVEVHGMTNVLETEGLTKIFGGLTAVNDVSFGVPEKSIVSIIGPNGAGKTTFFNMLTGLYQPSFGKVTFDGKDMTGGRPDRITKAGIARTFQNIRLFGTMTAVENVVVGAHTTMRSSVFGAIFRPPWTRKEERDRRGGGPRAAHLRRASPRATTTSSPPSSPTASSGASRSPGRCPRTPSSCCSTSRRPG